MASLSATFLSSIRLCNMRVNGQLGLVSKCHSLVNSSTPAMDSGEI